MSSDDDSISCSVSEPVEHITIKDRAAHKQRKPGILYLSTIPPYMNVTKVREIFSQYGDVGRVFLQPARQPGDGNAVKKLAKHFTEAWVELKSKRAARRTAELLNNSRIDSRKSSRFYDHIWTIKYLRGFKWVHLSERLAYERAVHKQRLRAEIAQAKREANHFSLNVDKSERLRRKLKADQEVQNSSAVPYRQRETEGEILARTVGGNSREDFLTQLFAK